MAIRFARILAMTDFARVVRFFVAALFLFALQISAEAQNWPTKPVKIIIPYPAGGGVDILGRDIAHRLQQVSGQTVIVENRPGSATAVGAVQVARSEPDGHTLLLTTDSTVSINQYVFSKLPYNPEKDFVPLTNVMTMNFLLTAHRSLKVDSLTDLVEQARKDPNKFSYASYGVGSQPQLIMEVFKSEARINVLHVPFKGGPESIQAAISGNVDLAFSNIPSAKSNIAAGLLKAMAIGGKKRSPLAPEVPTFAELGYPDVGAYAWYGLFLPAGVPHDLVLRIYSEIQKIVTEPKFKERQIERGFEVVADTPDEFAAYLKVERESRKKAVQISGIKID